MRRAILAAGIFVSLFAVAVPAAKAGTITTKFGTGAIRSTFGAGSVTTTYSRSNPGVIGNTSITDGNARVNNQFVYSSYTVTTAGAISTCHARISNVSTGSITIGVYALDGTVLAYYNGTAGTSVAWYGGSLNTSVLLAEGTSYILGVVSNDTSWLMFKDGNEPGHYRRRKTMNYATVLADFDFSSGYTSDSEATALNIQCDDTAATP